MAQAKKKIAPQPSPTGVEPEVRGSPLDPQPSPTPSARERRKGSPLDPSENKVYQNIRTVLVSARQKVYSAINSAMVEAY